MFTELLAALRAVPRILDALERLGDIATAQHAAHRKGVKDEGVDSLIDAARERRKQRMLEREAERLQGNSDTPPSGDGGGDSDG